MSQSVIITGAAGNLGSAVVAKLEGEGRRLYVTLGPHEDPETYADRNVEGKKIDLLDAEATARYVDEVFAQDGSVQAAILLVGGFGMGDLESTSSEDLDKMIGLNFKTAFHTAQPILRHFKEQGHGQFFFVGARPALDAEAGKSLVAYTLSKTLVFKLAELINAETSGDPITAHVIVPSIIDTPPNREAMSDADFSDWVPPARIAESIAFLLTEAGQMWRETVVKIYNRS